MLQRIAGPFREFGFFPGLVYSLNWVLRRISPGLGIMFHDWMVQPVPDKPILRGRIGSSFHARLIERGDPLVDAMPLRPEVKVSRFEQGAVCLGTFKGEELIGYIWLAFDGYREDEARCDFVLARPAESVFDFDVYVLPKHRGGFAFAAIWDGAGHYLRERGIRYSFSRLDHFNVASSQAHNHLGWKVVGHAIILRLWSAELLLATIKPRVCLLPGPSHRCTIRLAPDVMEEAA